MTLKKFRLKYKIPMIIGGVALFVGVITTLVVSNIVGNEASNTNNQILKNNEQIAKESTNQAEKAKASKDVSQSALSRSFVPLNVYTTLANRFNVPSENINMAINNAISSQSTNTNIAFANSNNAVAFSSYDFTMPIYQYANHYPLNQNLNEFNSRTNEYIGYQVFNNNGTDISKSDFGFSINDRFEQLQTSQQSSSQDLIVSQFSGTPLRLNNGDISIFAMEFPGAKAAYGNSTISLPPNLVVNNSVLAKAPYITNTNNFQVGDQTIFNKFFFNLLIANTNGTNSFFAPSESMGAVVKYNGSTDGNIVTNQTPAAFVNDANNMSNFSVDVTQAINHANDYFTIELVPRVATVDVNLTIKNYVQVDNVFTQDSNNNSTRKNIYTILPSKTFENILTLRGFAPAKTVTVTGQDITAEIDNNTMKNKVELGNVGDETSIGIGKAILNEYSNFDTSDFPGWTGVWDYRKAYPSYISKQPRLNNAIVPFATFSKAHSSNNAVLYGNQGIFDKNIIWANNVTNNNGIWAIPYYFDQLLNDPIKNSANNLIGQKIPYHNGIFTNDIANQLSSNDIGNWAFTTNNTFSGPSAFMPLGPSQYLQGPNNDNRFAMQFLGRTNSSSSPITTPVSFPVYLNYRVRNDSVNLFNKESEQMMFLMKGNDLAIDASEYGSGKYGSYFAANNSDANAIFEYLCGVISTDYQNMKSDWMVPSQRTEIIAEINGGIDQEDLANYSASQWIQNQENIKKIKIQVKGGIHETISQMSITLSPNDLDGSLKVLVSPGVGVDIGPNIFPHNGQVAEVIPYNVPNLEFIISGFSRDDNVQNTQIQSPNIFDISTYSDFYNAYITFGVDNYLETNQSINNLVLSKQEEILANAISTNYQNLYNIRTNQLLLPFENGQPSAALLSQIRNIKITIPSTTTGYNHLNLNFDLQGIAKNGAISNEYVPQTIKIMFKQPDRVSTYFNNNVSVYDPRKEVSSNPYFNPVADNILNTILDPANKYSNKYPLFNFLVSGYWNIDDYWKLEPGSSDGPGMPLYEQTPFGETNNFNLKVPNIDINNPNISPSDTVYDVAFLRSQWIYGYPSDYYLAYNDQNNLLATDDELSPSNWNFSAPSINDGVLNFSLALPYVINNEGLIVKSNAVITRTISGYLLNKNLNTLLTQLLFNAPTNTFLPSEWTQISTALIDMVKRTITNLPINTNISLVPEKYSNLDGTISFNVYPSSYYINGIEYTNIPDNNHSIGIVTFSGFKKALVTSIQSNFRASSFIDVNNNPTLPSNISPSSITQNQLIKILENDAFINLPSNTSISIADFSQIKTNGLDGQIIINPVTVGLRINQYYNEIGDLVTSPDFDWPSSIVISGFQQSRPTDLTTLNYTLTNSDLALADFDVTQAKQLALNLLENLPSTFSIDSDLTILEFVKNFNNVADINKRNTATFKIQLTNYYDENGNLSTIPKVFPISTGLPGDSVQLITISGFKNIGQTTVGGSYVINSIANLIASNNVSTPPQTPEINNPILNSTITNFIFPIISNAPDSLVVSDIRLGQVLSINNIDGSLTFNVHSKQAYNANGQLVTNSDTLLGQVTISGFKKLPSTPTAPLNSSNNQFSLNNLSNIIPTDYTDEQIQKLLFDNLGLFLKNFPPPSTPQPLDKNNPIILKSDLHISDINRDSSNGSISVNVKLQSYYDSDPNVESGVVWFYGKTNNPDPLKDFGKVTINGFKQYKKTNINSVIDVRNLTTSPDFKNKLPNDVVIGEIRTLIKDNAIINPPPALLDSEIVINSRVNSNLNGDIIISVSLPRYVNEQGQEVTGDLSANISIIGFKSVRPTTVANSISAPNPDQYASDYNTLDDWGTIKQLILDNISSPVENTSSNNIIFDTPPVIDNFSGTITIYRPKLNRYYDSNGIMITTNRVFNDIVIFGFKTVSQATSIINQYNMQSSMLAIEYFDFLTNLSAPTSTTIDKLKQLILNQNFISGAPENLTSSDIEITINEINNISGTARITIGLKRYFDSNGILQVVSQENNYLTQNILLNNFASIIETDLRTTMDANINPAILPSDFISKPDVELKNIIYNRAIIGRWSAFSANDFKLNNKIANNLSGTAIIEVEFLKYIDAKGVYHDVTTSGEIGLIKQIAITGFKQAQQTKISEDISYYLQAPIIPEFFIKDISQLKKYVFDYLIINRPQTITENDIEIDSTSESHNNLNGTVSFQARFSNNYFDANGILITNDTPSPWYQVTIVLDQTTTPTSIVSSQDISNYSSIVNGNDVNWGDIKASDFAADDVSFTEAVKQKLFNVTDFINNNQNYGDINSDNSVIPYNYENMILRNIPFFKNTSGYADNSLRQQDIEYLKITAANGVEYYGTPNNVEGTLTLTIKLKRYYDINGGLIDTNIVNTKPALELNTVLTGFKKITEKPIEIVNITKDNNSLSSMTANDASANLNSNSSLANLIINQGIRNWSSMDKNNNFMIIGITSIDNINGTLVVDFRIRDFIDESGLNYNDYSKNYSILISGFKETKPTTLTSNLSLSGVAINPEFVNLDKNANYNTINLFELSTSNPPSRVRDWVYQIIHANLNQLVQNQTIVIQQLANSSFNLSNMLQYITINNINLDYGKGIIEFDFLLYSYYSSNNGELIQQSTPLVTHMFLSGFYQNLPTTIISSIDTSLLSNTYGSDWETNNVPLLQFIINNQNLFFINQPYNLRIFDIKVDNLENNGILGSLTFDLSLSNYFNFAGNSGLSSEPLKQRITLSGFRKTAETVVTSTVNLNNYPANSSGSLDKSLEKLTFNNVRNFIFTYSDFSSAPIITNIPPNFSEGNIIIQKIDYNYNLGQAIVSFALNSYYDENGDSMNTSKSYKIRIAGFNEVKGITSIKSTGDVSSTSLANEIVTNIDSTAIKEYFSKFPSLLTSITDNLPTNFNANPLAPGADFNVSVIENSKKPTEGTLKIQLDIYKYFEQDDKGSISLVNAPLGSGIPPLSQEVELTGFRIVKPTAFNNSVWNLSIAGASEVTVGTMDNVLLTKYADSQEIKALYINNPISENNIITTVINVESIINKSVDQGTIEAEVSMTHYYNELGQIINTSSTKQLITFTGFKPQPPYYGIQASARFNLADDSSLPIASIYAQNTTNIMTYLNEREGENNIPRIVSMIANALGSNNPKQPQVVEIIGKNGENTPIFVDDKNGEVQFQIKVINMIGVDGTLNESPQVLKGQDNKPIIVTMSGLPQCSPTTWKNKDISYSNNINLSSSSTVQDFTPNEASLKTEIIKMIEPGLQGSQKQEITPNDIQINALSKTENQKQGTVSYQIVINNWWNVTTNNDQYPEFTNDSQILTKGQVEVSNINIIGLTSYNADTQNFLFIFSISAASVILFVLLAMIAYLVYRKWRVN